MGQSSVETKSQNLRASAIGGSSATFIAQISKFALQLVSTVVLARLLLPKDFGIYAMAAPATAIAVLIQDLGLTQAIMTARSIGQKELSAIFIINLIVSVLIGLAMLAVSPLVAKAYNTPELVPVIAAMALAIALTGLCSVHSALLIRNLRYGQIAMIEIGAMLGSLMVCIGYAKFAPGPLALVSMNVANAVLIVVLTWFSAGWAPTAPARLGQVRELLRFGGGVTGFNVTNFVARNADNMIIGGFLGATPLGYYDRAYKLMLLPLQQVNYPLARVITPILSRLVDEPERYRSAYLKVARIVLLITMPAVTFFIVAAGPLISVALGDKWGETSTIFVWLAIAGLHQPLTATMGWLFVSQSRTDDFAKWGLVNAGTCLLAFFAGLPWGVVGVAAAYALSDLLFRAPAVWWYVGRTGPVRTRDLFVMAGQHAVSVVITLGALLVVRHFLDHAPKLVILAVLGVVAYAVFILSQLLTRDGRATLAEVVQIGLSRGGALIGRKVQPA